MMHIPAAGGVGGPPQGEACWAVAVGPSQRPLERGAPVGRRSCPRASPGLQREPGEAPLWDGRSAATHRGVVEGRWVLLLWPRCQVCPGGQYWLLAASASAWLTSCCLPALSLSSATWVVCFGHGARSGTNDVQCSTHLCCSCAAKVDLCLLQCSTTLWPCTA